MIERKSFFAQTLFKSSFPLLIGGSYHLLKDVLSTFVQDPLTNNGLLQSHDMEKTLIEPPQDNGSGEPIFELLGCLNQISFGIYTNWFAFLLVMLLLDLLSKIAQDGVRDLLKAIKSPRKFSYKGVNDSEGELKLFNLVPENQIIRILCYILVFISF